MGKCEQVSRRSGDCLANEGQMKLIRTGNRKSKLSGKHTKAGRSGRGEELN